MKTFIPALAFLAFTLSATAQAETTNCTAITTVPYTIAAPGVYCFTGNLSHSLQTSTNPPITINADNVVLDLNGYMLDGSGAGLATAATGITAHQRQNVTIRNGTVRGFRTGISIGDVFPYTTSRGYVVEDMLLVQNTNAGVSVAGFGNLIRNNRIVSTGGSTISTVAYALANSGPGARILNNDIIGVASWGSSEAEGIIMSGGNIFNSHSVVAGNRISSITSPSGIASYAIRSNYGTNVILKDNVLIDAQYGIYFRYGSTGKYMNNVTQGVATPYTGGTAAGTTNY